MLSEDHVVFINLLEKLAFVGRSEERAVGRGFLELLLLFLAAVGASDVLKLDLHCLVGTEHRRLHVVAVVVD